MRVSLLDFTSQISDLVKCKVRLISCYSNQISEDGARTWNQQRCHRKCQQSQKTITTVKRFISGNCFGITDNGNHVFGSALLPDGSWMSFFWHRLVQ